MQYLLDHSCREDRAIDGELLVVEKKQVVIEKDMLIDLVKTLKTLEGQILSVEKL